MLQLNSDEELSILKQIYDSLNERFEMANTLQEKGRHDEALKIYHFLIQNMDENIAAVKRIYLILNSESENKIESSNTIKEELPWQKLKYTIYHVASKSYQSKNDHENEAKYMKEAEQVQSSVINDANNLLLERETQLRSIKEKKKEAIQNSRGIWINETEYNEAIQNALNLKEVANSKYPYREDISAETMFQDLKNIGELLNKQIQFIKKWKRNLKDLICNGTSNNQRDKISDYQRQYLKLLSNRRSLLKWGWAPPRGSAQRYETHLERRLITIRENLKLEYKTCYENIFRTLRDIIDSSPTDHDTAQSLYCYLKYLYDRQFEFWNMLRREQLILSKLLNAKKFNRNVQSLSHSVSQSSLSMKRIDKALSMADQYEKSILKLSFKRKYFEEIAKKNFFDSPQYSWECSFCGEKPDTVLWNLCGHICCQGKLNCVCSF
jgi:hypothetical protein